MYLAPQYVYTDGPSKTTVLVRLLVTDYILSNDLIQSARTHEHSAYIHAAAAALFKKSAATYVTY
jgi:hypothetical protein